MISATLKSLFLAAQVGLVPRTLGNKSTTLPSELPSHRWNGAWMNPYNLTFTNTFPQTDMRRLSYTFLGCILCLACLSEESPVRTYRTFLFLCHFLHACMRKCFTQAGALKSHKRIHRREKPFECDRCDKCFSEASNLRANKGTHSGERLFECDLCGKCFSRDWDSKRHKKRQHTDIYQVGAARRFLQHL